MSLPALCVSESTCQYLCLLVKGGKPETTYFYELDISILFHIGKVFNYLLFVRLVILLSLTMQLSSLFGTLTMGSG